MKTNPQFHPKWLTESGSFTWRSALALVSCCKAAYLPGDRAIRLASSEWNMQASAFSHGHTHSLVVENDEVVVVSFRGTDSTADWLSNINVFPRNVSDFNGSLHSGFLDAYAVAAQVVADAVDRSDGKALWITGHSLGGALAVIAALTHRDHKIAGLMTFGQPRLLGRRPAKLMTERFGRDYLRFVNRNDIVSRVPPGFRHAGLLHHFTGQSASLEAFEEGFEATEETEETSELTEAEFNEMQAQINAVRAQVETRAVDDFGVESDDLDENELLDVSVEGIIPGVSAHKIDAYLAEVHLRAANEISMQGVHETFMMRRNIHFSNEETVAEEPLDYQDFGVESGLEGLVTTTANFAVVPQEPYLVRLATPTWTPPTGVTIRSLVGSVASVMATASGFAKLRDDPMVVNAEASREAGMEEVDSSVPHVKGTDVHTRPDMAERGERAAVGVIDTGIDILHAAFDDANGASRIMGVWLQRDPTGPTPKDIDPAAFTQDYGTLYLASDIATYRQDHKDTGRAPPPGLRDEFSGHGTHVSSIAVGRAFGTIGDGMAPDAKIVVVSAHNASDPDNPAEPRSIGYSSSHVDALAFLKRVSLGGTPVSTDARPMAINVSLGMNAGAHDGQTTLEAAFDGITGGGRDPGLLIVKSAGNERMHCGHASAQIARNAAVEIEWNADGNSRRRDYLEAWYEPGDQIAFTLVTPLGDRIGPVDFDTPKAELESHGNHFSLAVSESHSDNGHNRLAISLERRTTDILPGQWVLEMEGQEVLSRDGIVHIWAERIGRRSIEFANADRKVTLSVPGTAHSVVTVGACNSAMPMKLLKMSSLGLTRDGRPKPELCAPGEKITAAMANDALDGAVTKSGTSMAAPHVTGAVALAFSARAKSGKRQVNAMQLQQKLRLTTQNFSPVHNPGFGSGILDAEKFFSEIIDLK